jgi:predicted ATP-dependent endonuclease of OLD family
MRLSKVIITGYRSIQKTEELMLDKKISILIGANDHGKTNLLHAIKCLNDNSPITEEERNWDLPDTDKVKIQWHLTVSQNFINKYEQAPIKSEISKTAIEPQAATVISTPQPNMLEKEAKPDLEYFPTNNDNELVFYREGVDATSKVRVLSTPVKMTIDKETELLRYRPIVELFEAPKTNLVDRVNLDQLAMPQFEFMQGIFILAGLWEIRDKVFVENDKTSKLLNEASSRLTTILNDKWNQGKNLKWKLIHVGNNGDHIEIKIQDPSVKGRYTRPSLRSSGFQTYFLISMIILARTQNRRGLFIYLFDEPGTYLHPHAQLDLQRSFEIISEDAQLIYTTHSLFLINKNYPNRNKVISKTEAGTKINQKPFLKNWKAVRDSLGILLSNNFLIAEKTLLTEGPSDLIYILSCIKRLKALNKIDIDLNDLSIVDAGNSENYVAMAKLMLSEGRDIVALLDGDKSGDDTEKKLQKICEKEIKTGKLQIIKLQKGNSTEDIFTDEDTLRDAIKATTDYLVDKDIRKLKNGIIIDDEIKKIKHTSGKTLGKYIDEITSGMFTGDEKLSKLSIALDYEDRAANLQSEPSKEAQETMELLRSLMQLRGEMSAEKSVFEEVSKSG